MARVRRWTSDAPLARSSLAQAIAVPPVVMTSSRRRIRAPLSGWGQAKASLRLVRRSLALSPTWGLV